MSIRLSVPDPQSGFIISADPSGSGRVLIGPSRSKHNWKTDERWYRSLILNPDGTVASVGWPKFGNLGEWSFDDHQQAFTAAMRDGQVRFTDKQDGSLIIRSVVDGKVMLRTRQSWQDNPHVQAARRIAQQRYPALLDPSLHADKSLLLEFVSPDPQFKIIVTYQREDLTLLGAVTHDDLRLSGWDELAGMADALSLPLVPCHELPHNRKQLLAELDGWKGAEGVVARLGDDQILIKLKSKAYLAMHRARFLLTPKAIREMCDSEGIRDMDALREKLGADADWEVLSGIEPYVHAYNDAVEAADARLGELDVFMLGLAMRYPGDRKSLAREVMTQLAKTETSSAFLLADGKEDQARAVLRSRFVDEAFAGFSEQPAGDLAAA